MAQTRRTALTPRQRFARLRRNERAALLEYVALLREKFGNRVQDVILYGSRAARGMPNRTWMCWWRWRTGKAVGAVILPQLRARWNSAMDTDTKIAAIKNRLERAQDDFETARLDFQAGKLRGAVIRAYYTVFHINPFIR